MLVSKHEIGKCINKSANDGSKIFALIFAKNWSSSISYVFDKYFRNVKYIDGIFLIINYYFSRLLLIFHNIEIYYYLWWM